MRGTLTYLQAILSLSKDVTLLPKGNNLARTPIVAGNWKMNTVASTARALVQDIRAGGIDAIAGVEKAIFPPFPFLADVSAEAKGSSLGIGAQNVHWEEKGAFTGEVSIEMLRGLVDYLLIGHSERRAYFCETDETVNKKLRAVLAAGLRPVGCVGETGAERQAGQMEEVLRRQVHGAFADITADPAIIVAYEPVWATPMPRSASFAASLPGFQEATSPPRCASFTAAA